jgi:Fur family ferric uptake transcriptional regulator
MNTDLLSKHAIHKTQPRRELVKIISAFGKRHFSVEDVLRVLKRTKGVVSRASIYRTINLFSKKGLLHAIDIGEGFQMYELAAHKDHHDHLYCIRCGMIIEFKEKLIEELQTKACKKNYFYPLDHTLRIRGLCKACKGGRPGNG